MIKTIIYMLLGLLLSLVFALAVVFIKILFGISIIEANDVVVIFFIIIFMGYVVMRDFIEGGIQEK